MRVIFNENNFTWLDSFNPTPFVAVNTEFQCAGDVLKLYDPSGGDYSQVGTQVPLASAGIVDAFSPTLKPSFIKNVSVDMTNTFYLNSQYSLMESDKCSYRANQGTTTVYPSYCADFDRKPFSASLPTPAPSPYLSPAPTPFSTPNASSSPSLKPFFGTGYYRVRDDWCEMQGPIDDPDDNISKSYIGGVNLDLNRAQLGVSEDVLMNLTYQAFASNISRSDVANGVATTPGASEWPVVDLPTCNSISGGTSCCTEPNPATGTNGGCNMGISGQTILQVQMISTQQGFNELIGVKQPRAWTYYNNPSFPIFMKDVTTLNDPYGGLRTEQVYIPLSQYPLVDRIRIERIRGTYILYQIDLYRLGERAYDGN